jgi:uncharacterized membrane protein
MTPHTKPVAPRGALRAYITACVLAALAMLPVDALWILTTSARLYRPAIGHLLAAQPDFRAALLFYAIYAIGIVVFAVRPGSGDSARHVALRAVLFGLVAYATYDLTNQATLIAWPWWLTGIDLLWGCFITTLAALAAHAGVRRWSGQTH